MVVSVFSPCVESCPPIIKVLTFFLQVTPMLFCLKISFHLRSWLSFPRVVDETKNGPIAPSPFCLPLKNCGEIPSVTHRQKCLIKMKMMLF